MTKIAHLITGLDSGGAEHMLCRLVCQLSDAGEDKATHLVVSMMDEGGRGPELKRAGISLTCLGMRRGRPSLGAFLRLWRLLRREKPDVLQTWLYHADLMGFLAGRLAGVRRISWNLRCSDMDMNRYSWLSRSVLRLLAYFSNGIDSVICNSDAGRRTHENLGYRPRRWDLIPNGFDLEKFRPDATSRIGFRADNGIEEPALVVGMVARLDPMKDHPVFLDAMAEVAREFPEVVTVLAGQGCEEGGALTHQIATRKQFGRVLLLGRRDDMAEIFPALDVLVLPSAFGEGFPNVIGEAMACGVPVVATEVGACREIVGDTGKIVPPGDAKVLAKGLKEILAMSPGERAGMGSEARARIERLYALSDIADRYESFYRSLVEG